MVTMEDGNLEERKVKIKISSVEISKSYKKLEGIITVTPRKRGGSHVIWNAQYEKTRPEIEDPHSIIDTSVKYFQGIDAILVMEMDEKIVKEMSEKRFKFILRSYPGVSESSEDLIGLISGSFFSSGNSSI